MNKIKICCLHPAITSVESIRNVFRYDEREYGFEFVYDENMPEYVVTTEMIYFNRKYQEKFLHYLKDDPIVIAFPGEFIVPDMNFTDYAIVWDRNLKMGDRIYRKPTMLYYKQFKKWQTNNNNTNAIVIGDKKFCNFIYSNGSAHPFRDKLFYGLSEYKRIESLGEHLNNVGNIPTRNDNDWLSQSIELKSNYKFSISCNNHYYVGGIDEKLLTSLAAKSVPIFWGDPTVEEEFNPKAIINCHNYESIDQIIEVVRKVDQDDELWYDMISQPWQTDEQKRVTERETIKYREFLTNIFMQDKKSAKRAGEGTWKDLYMKWFEHHDDKFRVYYGDLIQWINIKNSGKQLADYLVIEGYVTAAIYGFGDVGKCLLDELRSSDIEVKYAIDRNASNIKTEVRVCDFSDDWEKVDVIIVTPTPFYEEIEAQINEKCPYHVISLTSLLNNIAVANSL
jgi:hypothetical protein